MCIGGPWEVGNADGVGYNRTAKRGEKRKEVERAWTERKVLSVICMSGALFRRDEYK